MSKKAIKNEHMKQIAILLVFMAAGFASSAQLKVKPDCGVLTVDVYKGWINETKPNGDREQMNAKLACFTLSGREGALRWRRLS